MKCFLTCTLVFLLLSCSQHKLVSEARRATKEAHWDRSFQLWQEIYRTDPDNTQAKIQMEKAALKASISHLENGIFALAHRSFKEARVELNLSLQYKNDHQATLDALADLDREEAKEQQAEDRIARVHAQAKTLQGVPRVRPNSREPLSLYFPRSVEMRDVYQAMGRAYGLNLLVDGKIRGELPSLDLRDMSFFRALDTLMVLNRHFYKVIDEKTLIILQDEPKTRARYDNKIVKTYYLSNIAPNDLKGHLKSLGQLDQYATNDALNAVTLMGTSEQIALADHIIRSNDKPPSEVLVEIELLEVNKNVLENLGIQPVLFDPDNPSSVTPLYQAGIYLDPENSDSNGLRGIFPSLSSTDFITVLPSIAINFLKENSDSKQITNPHLRVTENHPGTIKIGQSVPVLQTAFQNIYEGGTSNLGEQALASVNYRDVGIEIQVTPRVHHNLEITLDLNVAMTSVVGQQELRPIFGQRVVTTTIRLKNGESSVLAGLLTDEERKSLTGFPGLSDIPLLGRLFSANDTVRNQTDIVLLLKPVILRGPNILPEDVAPYELSALTLTQDAPEEEPIREEPVSPASDSPIRLTNEEPMDESSSPSTEQPPVEIENKPLSLNEGPSTEATEPLAEETVLAFMPGYSAIDLEGTQTIQLFATNVRGLYEGELRMTFDPSLLQISDVRTGSLLTQEEPGARPLLFTPFFDNEQGLVSLIATPQKGTRPFTGSGVLAELVFTARAAGLSSLSIQAATLKDSQGNTLDLMPLAGRIKIDAP